MQHSELHPEPQKELVFCSDDWLCGGCFTCISLDKPRSSRRTAAISQRTSNGTLLRNLPLPASGSFLPAGQDATPRHFSMHTAHQFLQAFIILNIIQIFSKSITILHIIFFFVFNSILEIFSCQSTLTYILLLNGSYPKPIE